MSEPRVTLYVIWEMSKDEYEDELNRIMEEEGVSRDEAEEILYEALENSFQYKAYTHSYDNADVIFDTPQEIRDYISDIPKDIIAGGSVGLWEDEDNPVDFIDFSDRESMIDALKEGEEFLREALSKNKSSGTKEIRVKSHTRRTKSGKIVKVKSHYRRKPKRKRR